MARRKQTTRDGWATGYDGRDYKIGDRVEIHPGTDQWMSGARYGTVVGMSLTPNDRVKVELDKIPGRKFSGPGDRFKLIESKRTGENPRRKRSRRNPKKGSRACKRVLFPYRKRHFAPAAPKRKSSIWKYGLPLLAIGAAFLIFGRKG